MSHSFERIADGAFSEPSCADLEACITKIEPVIRKLMQRGFQPTAIIAALEQLTVVTVDR